MLTIEKNVPMPTMRGARLNPLNKNILESMNTMEVGDCFTVEGNARHIAVFVSKHAKKIEKKFTTSKAGEGMVRVWRCE
jgi:hypothetical protein